MDEFIKRCYIHYFPPFPIFLGNQVGGVFPFDLLSADLPDDPCLQLLCDDVQHQHMLGRL
jgi:hypothetical protein